MIHWNGKKRAQPIARLGNPALPAASVLAQAIWIDAVTTPACLAAIARALSLTTENVSLMKAALLKARDNLRWLTENEGMVAMGREHQALVLEDIERLSVQPRVFRGEADYPWCRDIGDVVQFGAVEFTETVGRDEREAEIKLWGWPDDHAGVPALLRKLADSVEIENGRQATIPAHERQAAYDRVFEKWRVPAPEPSLKHLRELAIGNGAGA